MANMDLLGKAVDSNRPARHVGTIKEYPVLSENGKTKHGVGLIRDDTTLEDINFHAKFLLNGHEDHLKADTRLSYTLCYTSTYDIQARDIRFENVKELHGTLQTYNDDVDVGIIEADDDKQQFKMDFDSIIGYVPEKFMQGLRVTFISDGDVAVNVRFVGLGVCCGRIKFYNAEQKFGFIVPDAGGKDVVFMQPAVLNIDEVHYTESRAEILGEGAPVTYELQRVPPMKREIHGKKGVQGTNVRLQHTSLMVIQEVIHSGPRDPLAHITPDVLRPKQISHPEALEVEEDEQPASECDLSLSSSYLGTCALVRLCFSRHPCEFHRVLDEHPDLSFRLPCGAYIFAPSISYASISAISHVVNLGDCDVIVTKELEASVISSIKSLPRRYKISIKHRRPVRIRQNEQEKERSEWDDIVQRTFIHVQIPGSEDGLTSFAAMSAS